MQIRIQMLRDFMIYLGDNDIARLASKSPKGVALMQMLILRQGEPISNTRLMQMLWKDDSTTNPESALKTLVSRLRTILNQVSPDLAACLVTDRGGYRWVNGENISVDVLDLYTLLSKAENEQLPDSVRDKSCEEMIHLYRGDLLQESDFNEWVMPQASVLHTRFVDAVKKYVDRLKKRGEYDQVASTCRSVIDVDSFDDDLHIELMNALVELNRPSDALQQYKHTVHMYYHYLGVQPSPALQEFHKKIVNVTRTLEISMDAIRNDLQESSMQGGAFVCEYAVFRDIYNMQIRNFVRLNTTLFLGLINISFPDDDHADLMFHATVMDDLVDVLKRCLRKGDTISRYSASMVVMMLPTANYTTSNLIMERVKKAFYKLYPSTAINFDYRVTPLTGQKPEWLRPIGRGDTARSDMDGRR